MKSLRETRDRWTIPHVNPDKLFDYLDGRLPEHERRALEEELMNSAEARREFEVARRIHSATRGSRERVEVLDEVSQVPAGRPLARQILLATLVLVAVNVMVGLLYIAHHESKNPNRALLEKQSREQLQKALDQAAAGALTPPPLGVSEMTVTTESGRARVVADEIVQLAKRLQGTATSGLPDNGHIQVLVEIAAKEAGNFYDALENLSGTKGKGNLRPQTNPEEKLSIVVQVTEAK